MHVYEFVILPSFVPVVSYNSCEPVYIIKINYKRTTKEKIKGRYGHSLAPGQLYLKGNYLKLVRLKNISRKKFSLILGDVLCDSDKVFDTVDVDHELSNSNDAYFEIVARSY